MIMLYTLLVGLGAYRLWRILAEDKITEWFRDWLYLRDDTLSVFIADLVSCVWCLGFWYAGALAYAVAEYENYDSIQLALVWLGGSVLAAFVRGLNDWLAER